MAMRTVSTRPRIRAISSSAASRLSVAWATVRTSPSVSPNVFGSSEMTRGCSGMSSAILRTSSTDTAQTMHSACVTMRSGSASRSSSSSSS